MSTISQVANTLAASTSTSSTEQIQDEAGLQAAFEASFRQYCHQFEQTIPGQTDVKGLVNQMVEASKNGNSNDADPTADDCNRM